MRGIYTPAIMLLVAVLLAAPALGALDIDSSSVKVRIAGFDPATNTYTVSCDIPPAQPGSQIDQLRYYAIDPVPQGYQRNCSGPTGNVSCFRSSLPTINWTLNPVNYTELVHTKALYHLYCEAQNYSAPPGHQNMASEIHVDLRTAPNADVPNIYVLKSEGTLMTMKCEPPQGVRRYYISWILRSRTGSITFPQLNDKNIVNITLPKAGSGWDITCNVFDRDTGKSSQWDMPIEAFSAGPAYVPTIEGCVPGEPCTWVHPSGIAPNGTAQITVVNASNSTLAGVAVFVNEELKGTTNGEGTLAVPNIVPGIYNLALRKSGYEEISTLMPISAGGSLARTYALLPPSPPAIPSCHTTIFSIPANCTGGSVVNDTGSSCRTITCANEGESLKVQACNKPGNNNAQYFEMYKQADTGNLKICLLGTCIHDNGYAKSPNFPIGTCEPTNQTNATPQNISFTSLTPSTGSPIIAEPSSQAFSYTLGNPSSLTTTTQWILDGIVQAATGNAYTFPGSYTTNGTHNLTVTVASTQNTIRTAWQLTVTDTPPPAQNETNTTCFSSAYTIPASCMGGAITQDTTSGCRTIICTGSGTLQVQACDKPGNNNAQYFEMYRQSGSGNLKICLLGTCISDGGYAKSPNFPICINTTNQTNTTPPAPQNISFTSVSPNSDPTIAEPNSKAFSYTLSNPSGLSTTTQWILDGIVQAAIGNAYTFPGSYTTNGTHNLTVTVASTQNTIRTAWQLTVTDTPPPNSTCAATLAAMAASCTGGAITHDTTSNTCRTIVCASGGDSMRALACDKPDGAAPQYFELYKQAQSGSGVSKICLGSTCIGPVGFAKSPNYPVC
jgi:hypothetical protein